MKRNKGNGNIIEKKETDQDKVMSEKEETEYQIGQNHDGIWRFEQYFTKNSPNNSDMAQALLSICLSGHPKQDVSKRR